MDVKSIVIILSLLMLAAQPSFAVVSSPSMPPHQFWGIATINGASAPVGTSITATIYGELAGSAKTTSGGAYNLIVENPNNQGDEILIFVNNVQAASDTFANGKSTNLDLAITVSTPPPPPGGGGSGGSGGSGSGGSGGFAGSIQTTTTNTVKTTSPTNNSASSSSSTAPSGPCKERWTCDAWSECTGGIQKRSCADANKCGTIDDLPLTTQPCENIVASADASDDSASKSSGLSGITGRMFALASGSTLSVVGLAVLVGLGAYFFKRKPAVEMKSRKR